MPTDRLPRRVREGLQGRLWMLILPISIFFFVLIVVAQASIPDNNLSGHSWRASSASSDDEFSLRAREKLYSDPAKGPFWNKYFPDRTEATWEELSESFMLEFIGDKLNLNRRQIKKLAPHMDPNGDGHLSFEEFTAFVRNYVDGSSTEITAKAVHSALQEALSAVHALEYGSQGEGAERGRGCALSFNSKQKDYVELMNSGNLQFGGASPFTVELWLKPHRLGKTPTLISKYNRGKWGQYMVKLEAGGQVFFHREVAPWGLRSAQPLQPHVFHHVAAVYDGKRSSIWVNGSMWADQKEGPQDSDPQTPVLIGAVMDQSETTDFFDGVIDEVRVWNVARSQEDIRKAMHLTLTGGEQGLVGYWPLDECAGERAKDLTTMEAKHDGIMHGGEWVHSPVEFSSYHDAFGCVDALC